MTADHRKAAHPQHQWTDTTRPGDRYQRATCTCGAVRLTSRRDQRKDQR